MIYKHSVNHIIKFCKLDEKGEKKNLKNQNKIAPKNCGQKTNLSKTINTNL